MASKFEILLQARLDKSSSTEQIRADIKTLEKNLALNIPINVNTKSTNELKNSLKEVENAAKGAKEHTQGLSDIASKFSRWQIIGDVIHGVKNGIQDMVEQVFELDASLTELDKVTDLTKEGLQGLADDAFEVGEKIGATGKNVIDATTIFAQAGYEAKDALDLGEQAIMLQNVSEAGATAAGSAETLIAAMKAFNLEASDSSHVVDALNEVSNKYAVSVSDLATGIKKASASMAAGNNSLEETFGLVAAGTEILRQPGRVANGLSTITARLTKKNDEYIKSITGGMGVIDEQTGELRSTFDILQDLSQAWDRLTSVEKQELTEVVAGKTQRSLFTAIMTNFQTAVGATEVALNSEGSAIEENNKRMDSLEGKTKQLQSAWQNFSRNTINSEFVKGILSATTAIVNFADKIGGLAPIITLMSGLMLALKWDKITEGFKSLETGITGVVQYFGTLKKISAETGESISNVSKAVMTNAEKMNMAKAAISGLTLALTAAIAIWNLYKQSQEEANKRTQEEIEALENSVNGIDDVKKKYNEIKNSQDTEEEQKTKLIKLQETLNDLYKNNNLNLYKGDLEDVNNELDKLKQNKANELMSELAGEEHKYEEQAKHWVDAAYNLGTLGNVFGDLLSGVAADANAMQKSLNLSGNNIFEDLNKVDKAIEQNGKALSWAVENGNTEAAEQFKARAEMLNNTKSLIKRTGKDILDVYEKLYQNRMSGIILTKEQVENLELAGYNMDDYREKMGMLSKETEKNTNLTDEQKKNVDALSKSVEEFRNQLEKDLTYTAEDLENLNTEIDDIQSSYNTLSDAISEYNENGYMSLDTLQSLLALSPEYLSSLEYVNGQLRINAEAEENLKNKIQSDTLALIENAAMNDLKAISEEKAGKIAKTASENIERSGLVSEEAGALAAEGASGFLKLGAAMASAGQIKLDQSEIDEWANKWANITSTITKSISSTKLGSLTASKTSKSGSKKSSKEVYKPEIDALYKYENALDNAKDAVDRLNDALKNTDNFNEREKYLNQLIKATKDQIKATNNLKNAQVGQINNYIKQLKKQGFQISYNSKTNQLNINNMERLGRFTGDTAKNIEKMIKKIQDLNKDNRSLDGSIRDLNADISDFNDQIKALPEEKLKKFNELMEEFQQSRLDQIQNEIEDIQHEMENDPRLKMLEEQIAALEKQNDELDSQKELEEKLLAVEEAKIKLQNAQRQKTLQVYREGQGFVWETDPDAIKEAADELQQAQDDLSDKVKQDQLDQLNAEKEALENSYQSRIDALQNFLTEQNYLIDKANREGIQTFEELQKKMAEFGLDNAENLKAATDWLNNYNKSLSDLNKTVGSILSSSTTATDGLIYSSQTQDKINSALSSIMPKIDSNTGLTLSNVRAETTDKDSNTGSIYINSIELPNVKDIDDFIAALKDLPRMASSQSTLRT